MSLTVERIEADESDLWLLKAQAWGSTLAITVGESIVAMETGPRGLRTVSTIWRSTDRPDATVWTAP